MGFHVDLTGCIRPAQAELFLILNGSGLRTLSGETIVRRIGIQEACARVLEEAQVWTGFRGGLPRGRPKLSRQPPLVSPRSSLHLYREIRVRHVAGSGGCLNVLLQVRERVLT